MMNVAFRCTPIKLPNHHSKRVNLVVRINPTRVYAVSNTCPHQGVPLHKGSVSDIEDMGIVWGSQISCVLHNWTFSMEDGKSASNSFVLDVYDVKLVPVPGSDQQSVFISLEPKNKNVEGPRRDFGGSKVVLSHLRSSSVPAKKTKERRSIKKNASAKLRER